MYRNYSWSRIPDQPALKMFESHIPFRLIFRMAFFYLIVWLAFFFISGFFWFHLPLQGFFKEESLRFFLVSFLSFLLVSIWAFLPLNRAIKYFGLLLSQPKTENIRVQDDRLTKVFRSGEWEDFGDLVYKLERKLRRRTKALLREKTELTAVMNSLNSPIIAVTTKLEVAFLNSACAVLFNFSESEAKKESGAVKTLGDVVNQKEILNLFKKALEKEDFEKKNIKILVGARERVYSLSMSPLRRAGDLSLYGVVASFNDETLKIELDQKRMDFVSNASHELRTPITAVSTSVSLLGKVDDQKSKDQIMDSLELNTRRLVDLSNDLLDLSKLEGEAEVLEYKAVDLEKMTQDVLRGLSTLDTRRVNVRIKSEVALLDESKVKQVLTNLIKNALIYSPENEKVNVTWSKKNNGEVSLSVQDAGPGVSEEERLRIFERFYRVDKSRSRKRGGSGIGLSIVKHIMALHGGEVTLENRPGLRGACFICTFPQDSALLI